MEKFLKNPVYMGIITLLILVVVVSLVWDKYQNNNKVLFGVLTQKAIAA